MAISGPAVSRPKNGAAVATSRISVSFIVTPRDFIVLLVSQTS
jgi:hypothetical protein